MIPTNATGITIHLPSYEIQVRRSIDGRWNWALRYTYRDDGGFTRQDIRALGSADTATEAIALGVAAYEERPR